MAAPPKPGSRAYWLRYGAGSGYGPYQTPKPPRRNVGGPGINVTSGGYLTDAGVPQDAKLPDYVTNPPAPTPTPPTPGSTTTAKPRSPWQDYLDALAKQRDDWLKRMMAQQAAQEQSYRESLLGFGQALQNNAAQAWGDIIGSYGRSAGESNVYQGALADQYSQGLTEANRNLAMTAAGIGQGGPLNTVDPAAARAQVETVGGAKPGETMGLVGKAWGSYGETRPGTIGFMTLQNEMQAHREGLQQQQDIMNKAAEMEQEDTKTAMGLWQADREFEENQRQFGLDYALKVRESRRADIALGAQLKAAGYKGSELAQKQKEVDASASKARGYLVDQLGRPIRDKKGRLQPVTTSGNPVNEVLSANRGYITDNQGNYVLDANGNRIPYKRKPSTQGGTGAKPTGGKGGTTPAQRATQMRSWRVEVNSVINSLVKSATNQFGNQWTNRSRALNVKRMTTYIMQNLDPSLYPGWTTAQLRLEARRLANRAFNQYGRKGTKRKTKKSSSLSGV